MTTLLTILINLALFVGLVTLLVKHLQQAVGRKLDAHRSEQEKSFLEHRARFEERQMDTLKTLQDTLQKGGEDNRRELKVALQEHAESLSKALHQLTQTTESKLKEINQLVEKRLTEGFQKTNETFHDVIKRLAFIDAAQKKITELSSNVVTLQEILNDKRSRGAFGEVQLTALIRNVMPEQHFSFQHTLSNDKRPDCILFLPEPTGNVVIDAKFPLENYKILIDNAQSDIAKREAERQFKVDIKKHIQDIAEKYILPGETADGAVMFIPAESIFAEIHAHHPDLVELAQREKVWLVSPTTMMAILTTARAVLKDAATRKEVHEIQKHLRLLADDFGRFQLRMDNLAKHIKQAQADVDQVHTSSQKISQRFLQIDKADFTPLPESILSEE
jgi:DNA recombination protein RmuC